MDNNILVVLCIIFGILSIVSIILFIHEIKRAPILSSDVDF